MDTVVVAGDPSATIPPEDDAPEIPTPSATASPQPTPTAIPTIDGRVLNNAYVFTRGGSNSRPWVVFVRPGASEAEVYMDGYVSTFGEPSRGRLPMIVGGFGRSFEPEGDYFYDQRLVLATLPDAEPVEIAALTSYYEETASRYFPSQVPVEVIRVTQSIAFSEPAWSPDERYLAFVAAIEGPAADVYVYDSEQGTIERVATGPMYASDPVWSPDGRGLLYQEIRYKSNVIPPLRSNPSSLRWVPIGEEQPYKFVDSSIPMAWHFFHEWLDNQRFTFWSITPGGGEDEHFSIGNLDTGKSVRILEDTRSSATLRVGDEVAILAAIQSQDNGYEFLLIDGASGQALPLDFSVRRRLYTSGLDRFGFFLVSGEEEGLFKVLPDGTVEKLIEMQGIERMSVSPDERKIAVGEFYQALWLYELRSVGSITQPFSLDNARYVWRPDSQALLITCDEETTEIATVPDWTVREYSSSCPAWTGLWPGEGRRPVGILWLESATD
ncbi:MAG: TolB family protein [Anaerolineales bacterium]